MIHGKQVFLRGLEREDLDLLHRWLNDEEVMRWARSKPDHVATAAQPVFVQFQGSPALCSGRHVVLSPVVVESDTDQMSSVTISRFNKSST